MASTLRLKMPVITFLAFELVAYFNVAIGQPRHAANPFHYPSKPIQAHVFKEQPASDTDIISQPYLFR
jgi:hypothetical protein